MEQPATDTVLTRERELTSVQKDVCVHARRCVDVCASASEGQFFSFGAVM